MFGRVIQILILIASLAFLYWLVIWILGLLHLGVPDQLIVCAFVILGLTGLYGIVSGKADSWWGPRPPGP
jgi:hypothetical protein